MIYMHKTHLKDFKKGWFLGNFEPSLFVNDNFEVAIKRYKKGDAEASHVHKIATEWTAVVSGKVRMNDMIVSIDEIVEVLPFTHVEFEALEDSVVVAVKSPCAKDDKYPYPHK